MTQKEVIERMCVIASLVGIYQDNVFATDCFCGKGPGWDFRFEEPPLKFIEEAVVREIHRRYPMYKKNDIRAELRRRKENL